MSVSHHPSSCTGSVSERIPNHSSPRLRLRKSQVLLRRAASKTPISAARVHLPRGIPGARRRILRLRGVRRRQEATETGLTLPVNARLPTAYHADNSGTIMLLARWSEGGDAQGYYPGRRHHYRGRLRRNQSATSTASLVSFCGRICA